MGAILRASPTLHRVYAPYSHALPVIHGACGALDTSNISADILVTSCWTGIDRLPRPSLLFKGIWPDHCSPGQSFLVLGSASAGSGCSQGNLQGAAPLDRRGDAFYTSFTCPLDWKVTAKPFEEGAQRVLACGPGKSTVNRYFINRLLTHSGACPHGVAFLDLDPAQREFGAPGEIALSLIQSCILGPSFAYPHFAKSSGNCILHSHHVGSAGPKDNPEHYMQCVMELMRRFEEGPAKNGCSLIVNAHGWIHGRGHELLRTMIRQLKVTALFCVQSFGLEETFQHLKEFAAESEVHFYALSSPGPEVPSRSASDLQGMQAISYFHSSPHSFELSWTLSPLRFVKPLELFFAGPSRNLGAVVLLGDQIAHDSVFEAINGSVVGVISVESKAGLGHATLLQSSLLSERTREPKYPQSAPANVVAQEIVRTSDGIYAEHMGRLRQAPLHSPHDKRSFADAWYMYSGIDAHRIVGPSRSRSLAQAFVRGIDLQHKTVQLVTPMHPELIQSSAGRGTLVLVKGRSEGSANLILEAHDQGQPHQRREYRRNPQIVGATSREDPAIDRIHGMGIVYRTGTAPFVHAMRGGEKLRNGKVWKARKNLINTRSSIRQA